MLDLIDSFKDAVYEDAKLNGWLYSDKKTMELITSDEWVLLYHYGEDENLLFYTPYIPLMKTPCMKENEIPLK